MEKSTDQIVTNRRVALLCGEVERANYYYYYYSETKILS
jgi:hypothetical protein